jgi:hypothetical protein
VIDLIPFAKVHMAERLDHVEQPARMNVDPRAPQGAAKHQEV